MASKRQTGAIFGKVPKTCAAPRRKGCEDCPDWGANSFWVYILEKPRGKFYIGQTEDLDASLVFHNRTDSIDGHFTRKNGPWELVWSEEHGSRQSAMRRERQIKRMKSAKWIRDHLLKPHSAVNPDKSRIVGSADVSGYCGAITLQLADNPAAYPAQTYLLFSFITWNSAS